MLVDFDPQGSLTVCCGYNPDALGKTIYNALMKRGGSDEVVLSHKSGVDLLPANIDLSLAEVELVNSVARERRLGIVLEPLRDSYDFILIDCHPSLGLLTINALAVADEVLIPVACEFLAIRGVQVLLRIVGKIRIQLNSKLRVTGVLPTMYDRRTKHAREVLQEIRSAVPKQIPVFNTIVYRSIKFAEAAQATRPIFDYAKEVPGAQAYLELAKEVMTA